MQLSKQLGIMRTIGMAPAAACSACEKRSEGPSTKLSGEVEMDATYLGGKESPKHADKKKRQGRESLREAGRSRH
ncbi:MAG: hypothetical protein ISN28_07995, partial [Ectothiorhodospiraceae bacterium AqS1]|nr:hypothetical protein [Ectothiorhodospiraceae bacterium AqS1]